MRTSRDLIIDAVLLLAYLVSANPATTGLAIHEWISIGVLLVALVHTVLHWDWTLETARRFFGKLAVAPRWNLVIDAGIFLALIVVTVSGLGVSRYVLIAFDYVAPGYFVWKPMHAISAVVLLALVIVHLVMHWKWVAAAVKTRVLAPLRGERMIPDEDTQCTDRPERVS